MSGNETEAWRGDEQRIREKENGLGSFKFSEQCWVREGGWERQDRKGTEVGSVQDRASRELWSRQPRQREEAGAGQMQAPD